MSDEQLKKLFACLAELDERLNRPANRYSPYVGENAFATKAGIHASAMAKDSATYEHVTPDFVSATNAKSWSPEQAGN